MANPDRIRQAYGYLVCLVAIVTVLVVVPNLVDHVYDLGVRQSDPGGSFEAFRANEGWVPGERPRPVVAPDSLSEAELRRRHEIYRADREAERRDRARSGLVKSGLLAAIAVALFATHWRLARAAG